MAKVKFKVHCEIEAVTPGEVEAGAWFWLDEKGLTRDPFVKVEKITLGE